MALDPRTGIFTYDTADVATDPSVDLAANVAPSTATGFAPTPAPAQDQRPWNDILGKLFPITSNAEFGTEIIGYHPVDYQPYGYFGEGMILDPLNQLAGAAGLEGVDWAPYLDQYWRNEWEDQLANQRKPWDIWSHKQGYGDTLLGVSDLASQGLNAPGLAEAARLNVGPGTPFYQDYNTVGNWIESRRDEKRDAGFYSTAAFLLGGLLAPGVSEWAGGGLGGGIAAGAAAGGLSGLAQGDPVGGAARGAVSAGVQEYAAPAAMDAAGGMLDRLGFDSAALFADLGDTKRASGTMMPAAVPEADPTFGGMLSQVGPGMFAQPDAFAAPTLMPAAVPETDPTFGGALKETAPGVYEAPAPAEPSTLDTVVRYAKLGNTLANMFGGGSAPGDAPQRGEGQSDAEYGQALADYIQVDAQALAKMGLTPGTPDYYDYLMSQLDVTVADMTRDIDVNAADLSAQLRGKTQAELTALRRALYVRGQLDLLMGSGTYTDPFTGIGEDVIAGGRQVQPGVAAYHRGLGRTIGEFGELAPGERQQAIGGFLEREPDLYGAGARADERARQEGEYLAWLEDLKRRQGGMFGANF